MESIVRRRPTADPLYPGSRILRCSFSGHRPQKMPFGFDELDQRCVDFKQRLHDTIESLIWCGYSHFLSGGALGMDMYAAEIVLELRHEYPWIGLEMVIPFDQQPEKWSEQHKIRYYMLLDKADIVTYTSHTYNKGALFLRNRYLVDNADLLLAAYDGQAGGTQMTCDYARKCGVEICKIPPVIERSQGCSIVDISNDIDELLQEPASTCSFGKRSYRKHNLIPVDYSSHNTIQGLPLAHLTPKHDISPTASRYGA